MFTVEVMYIMIRLYINVRLKAIPPVVGVEVITVVADSAMAVADGRFSLYISYSFFSYCKKKG